MLKSVKMGQVKILPGLFRERMNLNINYLKELDLRCLLQNYYLEAGEIMDGIQVIEDPSKARLHWGWEAPTCQLRGHFLGHWLSASAFIVANEGDKELEYKIDHVISELSRLQKLSRTGWVGPIPEKYFDILMTDRYIWSPQYTMHKLIMGLTEVYILLNNETAKEILSGFADWYLDWTKRAKEYSEANGTHNATYAGEQAGMLEVWAKLYDATKDDRYKELVRRYEDNSFFEVLDHAGDPLTDNHANASIPLVHSAAEMYEITGDKKWLDRVEAFWKIAVTDRGMYATGSSNTGEFWIPMKKHSDYISTTDQEFCTMYNMVRVANWLFGKTGDVKYQEFIEKALYNGFLAQQSRVSGMTTYFLPLVAGSKKKWSTKTRDFWCCQGTMIQAQTIYSSLIYNVDEEKNELIISQFIPSEAELMIGGKKVNVMQNTGMKNYSNQAFFDERGEGEVSRWALNFTVNKEKDLSMTVAIRVPEWSKGTPVLAIGGKNVPADKTSEMIQNGYIIIPVDEDELCIGLYFETEVETEALPDDEKLVALKNGPVVLAGITDKDMTLHGENVSSILRRRMTHTYSTWPWEQDHYVTKNQEQNIEFVPLYEIEDEAYTVYFTMKK